MINVVKCGPIRSAPNPLAMDLIEPHFFGSSARRMYGVYHAARGRSRGHGVVLCPPGPREYMRSHTALRKLAMLLARERFDVLRFDYYATGDSAGESREGSLSTWRQNIVAAADDLRECSGVRKISVVGFRLGAALAASAPMDMANLVLWEPVVDGGTYVNELRALHRRQFGPLLFPPRLPRRGYGGELLGIPLTAAMETELYDLDLLREAPPRAEHIAVVVSQQRPEYDRLRERLQNGQSRGAAIEYCLIPAESQSEQEEAMLVSGRTLQAMASVLTRRVA